MAWVVCVFLVQALPSLRWRSTNNDPRFFCWFHCMLGECPVCKKRDNEMSEKFSINDLYAQYWHCRDFEISHLWQRSIFLGTFLALCFTGYGAFFLKAFFSSKGQLVLLNCIENSDAYLVCSHFIALVIAFIGAILSVLWVCMAKASKAWVEVYEAAISAIDTRESFFPIGCDFVGGFHMERLANYGKQEYERTKSSSFSNCIFSVKGGCFSPSKINVCLGQISLIIWLFIMFAHIVVLAKIESCMVFLMLSFFIVMIIVVRCIKSDNLRKKDPAKTYFNKIYRCDNTMNFKQFVVSLFLIPPGQIFIAIHNRYFN